ncbi:aminotransferase class I/II-fold pyridoxal phosphate-dependent enzyme [bacterium]|nr:aminotransferase class I/II-fold pyridoxal phosphate-dependent enzyme [bacterium]MCP5463275.1 aminotransferase class I/II-fold pyridoxal phosphate-dependent enzyme [bacterium]
MKDFRAELIKTIPPSGIRAFFDLVIGMKDVVSLGVGEPDFVTPWHICESAIFSIEKGMTSYTSNLGLLELRHAIADYLLRMFSVKYDPKQELIITVGASEAMDIAFRAVLNPGDEVIILEPSYVAYAPLVTLAGGVPVNISLIHGDELVVDFEKIESKITNKTKAIFINYPNNPTGKSFRKDELVRFALLAEKHDLLVVSDEIYGELTYDYDHICFSSLPGMKERTILISGFSKAFAMTGWRIGYAAAPHDVIEAMMKIHQYAMLCAPISGQIAAIAALERGNKDVKAMKKEYKRRRNIIVEGFNKLNLYCANPEGAFYVFPSIKRLPFSSEEFCIKLLNEEKVAVVPGTAFGSTGEGFIRCAYAASIENIKEALRRIKDFLQRHDAL